MPHTIKPPSFGDKPYDIYKIQLEAWGEITDIENRKKGMYVALNLPDNDPSKIKEKIFESLDLQTLKEENGLQNLITFMDGHLLKEDLEEAWNRFEEFEDYTREEGESISTYITEFDRKYERVKSKGMNLPNNLLAFKLLKSAKISKEERLLVMTGIDITSIATMYDEAKKALKKIQR